MKPNLRIGELTGTREGEGSPHMGKKRYYVVLLILAVALGALVLLFQPSVMPPPGGGEAPALASSPSLDGWPRTFTDSLGQSVTFQRPVQRVVTMSPNLAEIVCAVGAADCLVGVDDFTTYPPEVATKPKIGGIINPNLESVLVVRPEVVLVARGVDKQVLRRLQEVGELQTLSYDAQTLDEVLDLISEIGRLCGKDAEAQRLVQSLRARKQAVEQRVAATGGPRPRVMLVVSWDGLFVAGEESFGNDLIETAGGENVVKKMPGVKLAPWPGITRELVVMGDPQVMIFAGKHALPVANEEQGILKWLRRDGAWRELSAVKHAQVLIVDEDLVTLPSPRLFDGLEKMAEAVAGVGPTPPATASPAPLP